MAALSTDELAAKVSEFCLKLSLREVGSVFVSQFWPLRLSHAQLQVMYDRMTMLVAVDPIREISVRSISRPLTNMRSPIQFEICFVSCPPQLRHKLKWKVSYAPLSDDEDDDAFDAAFEELDSVLVGPIAIGNNRFTLDATMPDPAVTPMLDLLEIAFIQVKGLYLDQEFYRCVFQVDKVSPQMKEWRRFRSKMEQIERAEEKQEKRNVREALLASQRVPRLPKPPSSI